MTLICNKPPLDRGTSELNPTKEVARVGLATHRRTPEVLKPGEESRDVPAAFVTAPV